MQVLTRRLSLLLVALLLVAGCGGAETENVEATPDPANTTAAEAEDEAEEEPEEAGEFRWAYAGEGEDGCLYEGPSSVQAGTHAFSITNTHAEDRAMVTLARIAEGHSYDDFLATIGDERPARPPDSDRNPAAHDWLEGDWRIVLEAAPGEAHTVDALPLTEGTFAVFCWGETPVPGEETKLWPSTELTVTE